MLTKQVLIPSTRLTTNNHQFILVNLDNWAEENIIQISKIAFIPSNSTGQIFYILLWNIKWLLPQVVRS